LEYFRLNNPNGEARSKECVLAKGICDSVDKGVKLRINYIDIKVLFYS